MFCGSCGADVPGDSRFCPKCGNELEAANPTKEAAGSGAAEQLRESMPRDRGDIGDERELWEGGFSGKAMIGSWCFAAVATIVLAGIAVAAPPSMIVVIPLAVLIWIYLAAVLAYRKLSVSYALTTQRFIHKVGILRQVTDRLEVIDIDDVTIEQGIVQRMVGVGKIRISSSDRTHPELVLLGIDSVKEVADTIDDVRRRERRARGLHIEAI